MRVVGRVFLACIYERKKRKKKKKDGAWVCVDVICSAPKRCFLFFFKFLKYISFSFFLLKRNTWLDFEIISKLRIRRLKNDPGSRGAWWTKDVQYKSSISQTLRKESCDWRIHSYIVFSGVALVNLNIEGELVLRQTSSRDHKHLRESIEAGWRFILKMLEKKWR